MKTLIDLSTAIFDDEKLFHKSGPDGEKTEMRRVTDENGNESESSVPVNGCTYNFNKSVDRLCFKNALARFIRTGAKEDAFDVFFCFSEIYRPFGGYKEGIDALLDLLYQHETNSASLLTKHRDHYSHSVYVFALGLALFTNNANMRRAFAAKYGEENLYSNFLKYWGMAALFHDIGYPYEISFLQVIQYGEKIDRENVLGMHYANLEGFTGLTDEEIAKCGEFMPEVGRDINALFANEILKSFGALSGNDELDRKIIETCLADRVTKATKFMDHGYFSAVLFLKKLLRRRDFALDRLTLDAVMAMLLHNSFYKRTYKNEIKGNNYEQIHLKDQPLAYLLMLCDELQCWDRVPYGEVSRKQELAWDVDLYVDDRHIDFYYYFEEGDIADTAKVTNLVEDIKRAVVDPGELAMFSVKAEVKKKDKKVYDYFSDSKFINLCKIAEAINTSYVEDCEKARIKEFMRESFDTLTLEYKLSNVAQAKNYVRHLENINCFFSDKKYDYRTVTEFTENELEYLAVNEHIRWVNEKVSMGWKYGTEYNNRTEREQKRIHKDIIPYSDLTADEKKKDYFPINNMVKHLADYGIKVYRRDTEKKPKYVLGCTGHRDLSRIKNFDEEKVRANIRAHMRKLGEKFTLELFCGFADGADLLFAEEALKCGADVIAVLPCAWKDFMGEHSDGGVEFMQILGQTKEVRVKPNNLNRYQDMSRYIVRQCDEMLVLWDGEVLSLVDEFGNEINRGGTYDTMVATEKEGKTIKLF